VQVSFDIDANGLLQVSATDRTTGRQQSVSIQGGTNLSEEEITRLLEEAERKAVEDRRRRSEIDRRNRAQTLVSQAERRLRDAALELGPYGAERQQRSVELALRDVQDLLRQEEASELDLAVSQLQEALFGLNRRLLGERRAEGGPLQGIKNTLGSLRDELFADDDWDDWDRDGRSDPWSSPPRRAERWPDQTPTGLGRGGVVRYDSRDAGPGDRWERGGDGPPRGYGGDRGYGADGDDRRGGWSSPGRSAADPSWREEDRFAEPVAGRFPDRRSAAYGDDDLPAAAASRPRRAPDTEDPWADG
jgi:molecular chaperone DnaK